MKHGLIVLPRILNEKLTRPYYLARAQARTPDCGDFSSTDLVFKRSTDGGRSWSSLDLVVRPESGASGLCGHPLVIGNAAPVQISKSGG